MNRDLTFEVLSCEVRAGRLILGGDGLQLHPNVWLPEHVATIRRLLAAHVECLVHLEVADNGSARIVRVEAGECVPRLSAAGGVA
jgi:hypothetical protein